jgi:flagellar basal-body rod modification protein FlgD
MSNLATSPTANAVNSPANSTTGTTGSSGTGSSSSADSAVTMLGSNFNTFLTLLTTQLQNQDPLSPLDSSQFTQQLVEFSQVEQQINTNNDLTSLITLQGQNDLLSSQSLVGQTVEVNSASAPLANDQISYSYTLPSTATATTLAITNAQGQVVWTGTGQTNAGTYNFTWNGENMNGDTAPAGTYTLNVAASGANGATITPTVASFGTVTAVSSQSGAPSLTIGGTDYPLSEFLGIEPSSS